MWQHIYGFTFGKHYCRRFKENNYSLSRLISIWGSVWKESSCFLAAYKHLLLLPAMQWYHLFSKSQRKACSLQNIPEIHLGKGAWTLCLLKTLFWSALAAVIIFLSRLTDELSLTSLDPDILSEFGGHAHQESLTLSSDSFMEVVTTATNNLKLHR